MRREEARKLLEGYLKDDKLVKHCIAVAAIMEALAEKFGEDKDKWYLAGLLHDIDYDETRENTKMHGLRAAEILKDKVDEEIVEAIKKHAFMLNGYKEPESIMEKLLVAADQISGLIVATALVMPDKKLSSVKLDTLKRKFKQKDFARRIDRELIKKMIEGIIDLENFLKISLEAMQRVSEELGL